MAIVKREELSNLKLSNLFLNIYIFLLFPYENRDFIKSREI